MGARLKDKVALVTGGSSGIGLAIARSFVDEGAVVYITGRRQGPLDEALSQLGGSAYAVCSDVSSPLALDDLYAQIRNRSGRLDVLCANAGGGTMLPLGSITEEQVDETFDRNVKAVIFTVQKALPLLVNGSSVILIGSTAGTKGGAAFSVYGASKAAVRSLARSWVLDLKERGIRVNVLSPGPVHTPGLVGLAPDAASQEGLLAYLAGQVPIGRVGMPSEIGAAAAFLASRESSFMNGAELFVDGGLAQV